MFRRKDLKSWCKTRRNYRQKLRNSEDYDKNNRKNNNKYMKNRRMISDRKTWKKMRSWKLVRSKDSIFSMKSRNRKPNGNYYYNIGVYRRIQSWTRSNNKNRSLLKMRETSRSYRERTRNWKYRKNVIRPVWIQFLDMAIVSDSERRQDQADQALKIR